MLVHSWQGWAGQAWARRRGRRRGRGRGRERTRAGRSGDGTCWGPLRRFVPLGQTRRKSAAGRSIGSVCGLYCALWGRELPSGRGTTLKMPIGVDMRALVDEPNGQRTTSTKRSTVEVVAHQSRTGSQSASQTRVRSQSPGSYIVTTIGRLKLHGGTHAHTHTHTHTLEPICFKAPGRRQLALKLCKFRSSRLNIARNSVKQIDVGRPEGLRAELMPGTLVGYVCIPDPQCCRYVLLLATEGRIKQYTPVD